MLAACPPREQLSADQYYMLSSHPDRCAGDGGDRPYPESSAHRAPDAGMETAGDTTLLSPLQGHRHSAPEQLLASQLRALHVSTGSGRASPASPAPDNHRWTTSPLHAEPRGPGGLSPAPSTEGLAEEHPPPDGATRSRQAWQNQTGKEDALLSRKTRRGPRRAAAISPVPPARGQPAAPRLAPTRGGPTRGAARGRGALRGCSAAPPSCGRPPPPAWPPAAAAPTVAGIPRRAPRCGSERGRVRAALSFPGVSFPGRASPSPPNTARR